MITSSGQSLFPEQADLKYVVKAVVGAASVLFLFHFWDL
jgi:hypothetical protein